MNIDNSGWFSLWSFAHDGKAGIVPAHTMQVKNVGSEDAYIAATPSGPARFTLEPGESFAFFVPAGDDLYAQSVTSGGTSLQAVASVH